MAPSAFMRSLSSTCLCHMCLISCTALTLSHKGCICIVLEKHTWQHLGDHIPLLTALSCHGSSALRCCSHGFWKCWGQAAFWPSSRARVSLLAWDCQGEGFPCTSKHTSLLPGAAASPKEQLERGSYGRQRAEICLITRHVWSLDDAGQSQCIFPHCAFCLLLFIWIWYNEFQPWLKKRGEGVKIGLLHRSCPFSICYPVSTHLSLPLSFCFWTKPKN